MRTPIPFAALVLAACGAPGGNVAAPDPDPPSAFQNQVAALSVGERNAVFIRAIRDAGHDCQGVTESRREGEGTDGSPQYVARCTDGATYAVLIGREGTAQVVGAARK